MSSALRRVLLLLVFVSAVAAAAAWWRDRAPSGGPTQPPTWPPLEPRSGDDDADPARPDTGVRGEASAPTWQPGNDDGSTPAGHPIKVKESSGIYHVPGGRFYDRTRPDRCYTTTDAAEADGYRRSKT